MLQIHLRSSSMLTKPTEYDTLSPGGLPPLILRIAIALEMSIVSAGFVSCCANDLVNAFGAASICPLRAA